MLSDTSSFKGVQLIKTDGRHGTEAHYAKIGNLLGEACGVVFKKAGLKTVYLAGDTIWHERVATALKTHRPDVAILNTGYAMVVGIEGGIIMGTQDVLSVHKAAPETLLIGSHMEAVNHCTVSRADLRAFARANGFEPPRVYRRVFRSNLRLLYHECLSFHRKPPLLLEAWYNLWHCTGARCCTS